MAKLRNLHDLQSHESAWTLCRQRRPASTAPGDLGRHRPSTARTPSSMSSSRTWGSRPACSASNERSINSRPSGTATESFDNPVAVETSNTLPAIPARSRFEVTGTTCVCQTSTPRTSSEETTTHGRRLSNSIQYTAPRTTTGRNAPSSPALPATPQRLAVPQPPTLRPPEAVGQDSDSFDWQHDDEADRPPMSRTEHRDHR